MAGFADTNLIKARRAVLVHVYHHIDVGVVVVVEREILVPGFVSN
jgi:hypothetical protein